MNNPLWRARPWVSSLFVAALAGLAAGALAVPFAAAEVHLSKDQEAQLLKACMAQQPKNGPDYCDCMDGAVQNGMSAAEYQTWTQAIAAKQPLNSALQAKIAGFAQECEAMTTPAR